VNNKISVFEIVNHDTK